MTAAKLDAEVCRRIAAECTEDDGRMGDARWRVDRDRFDIESPHWIKSGLTIVARVGDPHDEGAARASGIARTRNNLPSIAAQLTAAAELESHCDRLEKMARLAADQRDSLRAQLADARDDLSAVRDYLLDRGGISPRETWKSELATLAGLIGDPSTDQPAGRPTAHPRTPGYEPCRECRYWLGVVTQSCDAHRVQPALTADEVRAVVREAFSSQLNIVHGMLSPSDGDAIASRVAEKLAGRTLAAKEKP